MTDTTDLAERWRLRYAAFLCAVFDTFSFKGVPSEVAKVLENPASKSSYLDRMIQLSEVFFYLRNLCRLVPHGCNRSGR
jgi:hypothetical protein